MISDTLSDAVSDIEDAMHHHPDIYADINGEIRAVISVMQELQFFLDGPPGPASDLRDALREVGLTIGDAHSAD